MKATLTFSLPEEAEEHRTALDAGRWKAAVAELDRVLRNTAKHGDEPDSIHAIWARTLLHRVLEDNEVRL